MRSDGYSLIELLVALALTAVIATMMADTTRQLHPLRQIQAKYDARQVADRIADVIARDLKSAVALPLLNSDGHQAIIGTHQDIRFVAVVRTGYAAEGLREVSYSLQSMPDGTKRLVRKIALRRFSDQQDSQIAQTDDVFEPAGQLSFAYLSGQQQERPEWVDRWNRPGEMPVAIQITVTLKASDIQVAASRTIAWNN
jgi:prepilin-type N-terminal cleavage/methylation domain-containing protein